MQRLTCYFIQGCYHKPQDFPLSHFWTEGYNFVSPADPCKTQYEKLQSPTLLCLACAPHSFLITDTNFLRQAALKTSMALFLSYLTSRKWLFEVLRTNRPLAEVRSPSWPIHSGSYCTAVVLFSPLCKKKAKGGTAIEIVRVYWELSFSPV